MRSCKYNTGDDLLSRSPAAAPWLESVKFVHGNRFYGREVLKPPQENLRGKVTFGFIEEFTDYSWDFFFKASLRD